MGRPRILINAVSVSEGGGRSYLTNLLRELGRDDRGFAFTLLAVRGALGDMDLHGIPIEEVRLPARPGPVKLAARVLFEQLVLPLRARRHDLLFCVADVSPALGTTPIVVLLRNLNIYDRTYYDSARTRTLARLVRLGTRKARFAIFPSRAAADRILQEVPIPEARVAVVPYGVSAEAFRDGAAAVGEARNAPVPYLFLAAAPERHKNVETLLGALALLDEPLELWLAGSSSLDPGYAETLRAEALRLGIADRVRWLGAVPYAELLAYYRGAHAFVFPSMLETFGHPLFEAMLAGAPVVASDIPTFRELAGDVALYFPPRDAEALAARVRELTLDRAATKERVTRGQVRAAAYSWERSVDGLCEVIRRALAPAGSPGP